MSEPDFITVKGAREHNLKSVQLEIPKKKLVVFTGVSGSGKSSLAFDTLYAEGQRRYVESLSSYARQFLGQMEKPKYDTIRGLSPTISIEQKAASNNPRSTVGTITEVHDYLRVLYASIGVQHCPSCGRPVGKQTAQQIVESIEELPDGSKILVLAPLVQNRKGEYRDLLLDVQKRGFARVRVDGMIHQLTDRLVLDKKLKHDIELVVDRLVVKAGIRSRLTDSVETALREGKGTLVVADVDREQKVGPGIDPEEYKRHDRFYSELNACHACGLCFGELAPQGFSFNSPARLLPRLPGPRDAGGDGPGPHRPGPLAHHPRRRGGALGERDGARGGLDLRVRGAPLPGPQDRSRHPLVEAPEAGPRGRDERHRGGRQRAQRVPDRVRGGREPALPPVQVHRLRGDAALLHALLLGQALPDLRRRAAQAREPRGEGPRPRDRRAVAPHHPGRPRLARRPRPQGERGEDRGRAPQGDPQPAQVPPRRRPRLPHPRPARPVPLRRREPAHPPRLADGLGAHRRHLHPRRAVHRPAPARQRQAPRDAEAAARRRQLGHRRRARRGDDGGGRLARGLRPRRRRPRRRGRLPGHARGGEGGPRLPHRRVPLRPARDRAARPPAGRRPRGDHHRRGPGEQPQGPDGLHSRSAGWWR